MSRRLRIEGRWRIGLTIALGISLQLLPLPETLAILRPPFAILLVIFWSLMAPRLSGIGSGFAAGLVLDVYLGSVLGQHALSGAIIAYVVSRQHLMLRTKPVFEQSLLVGAALLVYELTVWLIEGWLGQAQGDWTRWLSCLTGAVIWPLLTRLPTGRLPERN
jgi:rod shape-determining protein MreD